MNDPAAPNRVKRQIRVILAVLIVLAFAAIVAAKAGSGTPVAPAGTGAVAQPQAATSGPSQSHADASVGYEKALARGKPVYVLFHSLTCDPCIEISAVVDKIIPAYEGKVVFVNAITTDEPAARLADKFQFQYIPQSFFIDSKGNVVDSFTGAMDESAMKAYLDRLVAQ